MAKEAKTVEPEVKAEVAPDVAAPVDANVKTTDEGTYTKDAAGVVVLTRS